MKLYFTGHDFKYAVEQMLMTLFPAERPEYPDTPPGGDNEAELSVSEGAQWLTASACLRREGHTFRRLCRVKQSDLCVPAEDADRLRRRTLQRAFYQAAIDCLGTEPPWGMLTGVRPVKLPMRALAAGASPAQAERLLETHYHVSAPRRRLAMDCALAALRVQQSLQPEELSLYVGIPFCPTRCSYCSFISAAGRNNRFIPPYLDALLREIDAAGRAVRMQGRRIKSLYIGGGTPTTLTAEQLARVMAQLQAAFALEPNLEYTVEAGRPDTITREKLEIIRQYGGNRVSVNPQSLSDEVLHAIGRAHGAADTFRAYDLVRQMGFSVVNMDLIAGLPKDSPAGFRRTLAQILDLAPENITVHTLARKRGSHLVETEESDVPTGEEVAEMLRDAWDALRTAGYLPYYLYRQKFMSGSFENVGWCKPDCESIYNICMMEELHPVLSLGAGAVSKTVQPESGLVRRLSNPKYPQDYIRAIEDIVAQKADGYGKERGGA